MLHCRSGRIFNLCQARYKVQYHFRRELWLL